MFEQFRRVEVSITRYPCRCEIGAVRQDAKIGDESHPVLANEQREYERNNDANHGTTPQRNQWSRIRIENAEWQVPRNQIGTRQSPSANPSADNMPRFMDKRHDAPRRDEQDYEFENAIRQSSQPQWSAAFKWAGGIDQPAVRGSLILIRQRRLKLSKKKHGKRPRLRFGLLFQQPARINSKPAATPAPLQSN